MGDIYRIAVAGIVAAVLILTVKKDAPAIAVLITVAVSALIIISVLPKLSAAVGLLNETAEAVNGGSAYVAAVLKIIGIAYTAEFGAQICADAGETAVAGKVELAGKVLIMTVCAPVVASLLNTVVSMF